MQLTIGLIVTFALAIATLSVRLFRRHPISLELFAQDALVAFGVGVAAGLVVVPTVGITWAFIRHNSTLMPAMLAPYDQNGVMFDLIAGAAAVTYLAVKAYLERLLRRRDDTVGDGAAEAEDRDIIEQSFDDQPGD